MKTSDLEIQGNNDNEIIEKEYPIIPSYKKDNIPLVFACNDKYAAFTVAAIKSILYISSDRYNYDIVVLFSELSTESKFKISNSIKQNKNTKLRFFDVSKHLENYKFMLPQLEHVSMETYYRLLIPSIFSNYAKVIWLDSDIIVKKDISELYKVDIQSNFIAGCTDIGWRLQYNENRRSQIYAASTLKLSKHSNYFQAGVLVFNIGEINKKFKKEDILEAATKHNYQFADQDILNMLFNGNVYYLDINWNICSNVYEVIYTDDTNIYLPQELRALYKEAHKNPYIIHYAGGVKPWDDISMDFAHEFWKFYSA